MPGSTIGGADRSTVRYAYVHQNGGAGIAVGGEAAPRLLGNLIPANGIRPGSPAPGIAVGEGAAPVLADNRIEGNGGGGVALPAGERAERAEEVFRWNGFGAVPREQAVRVAGAPPGAAAPPSGLPAPAAARAPAPARPPAGRPR